MIVETAGLRIPLYLPQEFRDEIKSWPVAIQSPYSYSFYNVPEGQKTWTHTPEGSLRISDHWNFEARGMLNCPTDVPVQPGTWTLARWEDGRYVVLKSLPPRRLSELSDAEAKKLNPKKQEKRLKQIAAQQNKKDHMNVGESANTPAAQLVAQVGHGDDNVSLDLTAAGPSTVVIEQIWSERERGVGHGTRWMHKIVEAADRLGVTLKLIAHPLHYDLVSNDYDGDPRGYDLLADLNDKTPNERRLKTWYERFGFVFDPAHESDAVRQPRGNIVENARMVTLYHGTCRNSAEALCTNGWKSRSGSVGGNMGQSRYLYLTSGIEDAEWFANEKGCTSVVAVTAPMDYLIVDPEDGAGETVEDELNSTHGLPGKVALIKSLGPEHFEMVK